MSTNAALTSAFLLVEETRGGRPVWAAKWRSSDGTRPKRRLGYGAWVCRGRDGSWKPRTGRPAEGMLTEYQARRVLVEFIEAAERQIPARQTRQLDPVPRTAGRTFRDLAHAWLQHHRTIKDSKPSTIANYTAMLSEPGTPNRRGTGKRQGRIMKAFGDLEPASITTELIDAWLEELSEEGETSARTVNSYRTVVSSILNYGVVNPKRWGITENAAARSHKRRVDEPGHLEVFTVEQVEAVARMAESGAWRTRRSYDTPATEHFRRQENETLGALFRIAVYTGLRRGEIVALKWSDIKWADRIIAVQRAVSAGVETTTKSRRVRYVPLVDQAVAVLDRLSKRPNFTSADDYVFATVTGERPDATAIRRRFVDCRDAAGLPKLRFHDLRHTAGTLLVRVLDPVTVKDIMGHAELKTTERYLHAVRAASLADVATRAFKAGSAADRDAPRQLVATTARSWMGPR